MDQLSYPKSVAVIGVSDKPDNLASIIVQNLIVPDRVSGFFDTTHTARHFRKEIVMPELVGRETREVWEAAGAGDMADRAREKAMRLLAEHHPPALPENVVEQLDEIVREAETRSGRHR